MRALLHPGANLGIAEALHCPHMSTPVDTTCTTVLFDGSCPMCRREISAYQKLSSRTPIDWVDVSQADAILPAGVSKQQALARLHVQTAEGQWVHGAGAFVALWRQLPGWRHLARLAHVPGMLTLMEWMYRQFLRVRPWIQRRLRA